MVTSCGPGWSLWVRSLCCPIPHGDTTKAGEPSPTEQRGVFRGISLFTAGPQSWFLPLVSALRREELGQHHTKGAHSPVPLQIPYTCCVPLHLPAHPRGRFLRCVPMCQGLQHCPWWEPKAAGLFGAGGWWEEPRQLSRALAKAAAQPRWLSAGWRECTAGQGGLELCPPPPEGFIPLCVL